MSGSIANSPTSPLRRHSRRSSLVIPNRQKDMQAHENVFSWSPEGRTRFIELVALQSVLSKVPVELEHRHADRDTATSNQDWRLLPPKVEMEVADHFAFLAATESGSEFVSAACIEGRSEGGIIFRLAMNEAVPRRILDEVRGFCEVLQRIATGENTERSGRVDLWDRVVEAEERNVVKNLKQKFARGSSQLPDLFRQALGRSHGDSSELGHYPSSNAGASGDSLPSGVTSMTGTAAGKDASALLEAIYNQCLDVIRGDVNSRPVHEEVRRLLDTCYQARKDPSFKPYLTKKRCPKALIYTIEKLGRYKAATHHLASMAARYPDVFKVVEVQPVDPPLRGPLPPPATIDHGLAELASELTGLSTSEVHEKIMNLTGISERALETSFEDVYLTRPHVHGEMQLVKFYEENHHITPPNFIGLSKPSCYLCNLFLHFHGKFNVPKSRPNIYLKWSIPPIACQSSENIRNFTAIMEQMNRVLEINCRRALNFDPNDMETQSVRSHRSHRSHRSRKSHKSHKKKSSSSVAMSTEWAPATRPQSLADLSTAVRLAGERLGMTQRDMQSEIAPPRKQSIDRMSRPLTSNGTASRASTKKDADWPSRASTSTPQNVPLPASVLSSRAETPRATIPMPKLNRLLTADEAAGGVALQYESGRSTPIAAQGPPSTYSHHTTSQIRSYPGPPPSTHSSQHPYNYPLPPSSIVSTQSHNYPGPSSTIGPGYPGPSSTVGPNYPGPSSTVSHNYPGPSSVVSQHNQSHNYPGPSYPLSATLTSPPSMPTFASYSPGPPSIPASPSPGPAPIEINAASYRHPVYSNYTSNHGASSSRLAPNSTTAAKTHLSSMEALAGRNANTGSQLSSKSQLRSVEASPIGSVGRSSTSAVGTGTLNGMGIHQSESHLAATTAVAAAAAAAAAAAHSNASYHRRSESSPVPSYPPSILQYQPQHRRTESSQPAQLRVDKGKAPEAPASRDLLSPLTIPKSTISATSRSRQKHELDPLSLTIERNATGTSHFNTQYTIYLTEAHSEGLSAGDVLFRGTINKPTEQSRIIQCKGFRLRASLRDVQNGGRRSSRGSLRESPLRVRQVEKSRTKMVMDITFSDATVRLEVFWDD